MTNPIFDASVGAREPRAFQSPAALPQGRPLSAGLSIELYGPEIPAHLLAAAEQSADNPYSCLAVCRAFQPEIAPILHHLVIYSGARVVGILSYYERGTSLIVVNRLVACGDGVLDDCVHALFGAHRRAHRIVIEGVYASATHLSGSSGVPRRAWSPMENYLLELPESFEQYMSQFGSKTRKNLRYCSKRFARENPDVEFSVLERSAIDKASVDAVIALNHLRMKSKGRESGMDTRFASGLLALCRSHGVACLARDKNGRILGGTLCTRVGNGLSLQVIAHDPVFNHVRLGLLCLLKSIESGIASGVSVFHFLWGDSEYKVLFGGRAEPLLTCRYYRSWLGHWLALHDWRDQLAQMARRYAKRLRAVSRRAVRD